MGSNTRHLKILILLPYYRNQGVFTSTEAKKSFSPLLPLSISYLAALIPEGHDIHVVDEKVSNVPFEENYDLVAISSTTLNVNRAFEVARYFKSKGSKIIMGGVHASLNHEETLLHCDAVCVGEAESVMGQIIEDACNYTLKKVYKEPVENLDNLPFAQHHLLKTDKYWKISRSHKHPIIPIFFSRGCPHKCLFCTVPEMFGSNMRFRPVDQVIKEVETNNAERYWFLDDNIMVSKSRSEQLFKELMPLNKKYIFHFDASSYKHPKTIELAGRAGCFLAQVGIESFNPEVLKAFNKKHNNVEKYKELVKVFADAGIPISASVIAGFDQDTSESLANIVNCLMECGFKDAQVCSLTAYPGTEFYRQMEAAGRITTKDWSKYSDTVPTLVPPSMTPEEYLTSFKGIWKKYFSISNIFKRTFFAPRNSFSWSYLVWALIARLRLIRGCTSPHTD